jgi:hypothetical protein
MALDNVAAVAADDDFDVTTPGEPKPAASQIAKPKAAQAAQAAPAEATDDAIKPPPPGFSPTAKAVWEKEVLDKGEWESDCAGP